MSPSFLVLKKLKNWIDGSPITRFTAISFHLCLSSIERTGNGIKSAKDAYLWTYYRRGELQQDAQGRVSRLCAAYSITHGPAQEKISQVSILPCGDESAGSAKIVFLGPVYRSLGMQEGCRLDTTAVTLNLCSYLTYARTCVALYVTNHSLCLFNAVCRDVYSVPNAWSGQGTLCTCKPLHNCLLVWYACAW